MSKKNSIIPFLNEQPITKLSEYRIYQDAKSRCKTNNKASKYYSERGIKFNFTSFTEFINHVGLRPTKKHTLDRINNNGHYEIDNVRWATRKEQMNNRRGNRLITLDGITKNLTEWAGLYKINPSTVFARIKRGWCEKCAITKTFIGNGWKQCNH